MNKKIDYKKQGKKNRASGAAFELRVRKDLESKGWIVDKWGNNVETGDDKKGWLVKDLWKLIPAKRKFNAFSKVMGIGTGFPDFMAFTYSDSNATYPVGPPYYLSGINVVIGVECKVGKYLDKIEKEKCKWLLDNKVFGKILIASKTMEKNKIKINYEEFKND